MSDPGLVREGVQGFGSGGWGCKRRVSGTFRGSREIRKDSGCHERASGLRTLEDPKNGREG